MVRVTNLGDLRAYLSAIPDDTPLLTRTIVRFDLMHKRTYGKQVGYDYCFTRHAQDGKVYGCCKQVGLDNETMELVVSIKP